MKRFLYHIRWNKSTRKISEKMFKRNDISSGFVGRIDKTKGWKTNFRTIELLPENFKAKFTFAGAGPEEKELEEEIRKVSESKKNIKIVFLGVVEHEKVNSIYETFDFLIFPSESESESLGLVGLEAMANGVPVIGSNVGGIRTYLRQNENGYIFITKDENDLLKSILKSEKILIENYLELSKQVIITAKRYSKEDAMKMMNDVFLDIM